MVDKILLKKQKLARSLANKLTFKTIYIPAIIESNSQYMAFIENTEISAYGDDKEKAIANAKEFAYSLFLQDSQELNNAKRAYKSI